MRSNQQAWEEERAVLLAKIEQYEWDSKIARYRDGAPDNDVALTVASPDADTVLCRRNLTELAKRPPQIAARSALLTDGETNRHPPPEPSVEGVRLYAGAR